MRRIHLHFIRFLVKNVCQWLNRFAVQSTCETIKMGIIMKPKLRCSKLSALRRTPNIITDLTICNAEVICRLCQDFPTQHLSVIHFFEVYVTLSHQTTIFLQRIPNSYCHNCATSDVASYTHLFSTIELSNYNNVFIILPNNIVTHRTFFVKLGYRLINVMYGSVVLSQQKWKRAEPLNFPEIRVRAGSSRNERVNWINITTS